jgi:hypothetical protein
MNKFILSFIILGIISSCNHLSQQERELRNTLNSTVTLEMFESVQRDNFRKKYSDFRKEYKYIYIVYLIDSCTPCYGKYIEWHKRMESFDTIANFTVLFIIQGYNLDHFLSAVQEIEPVQKHYYVIMDSYMKFIENNDFPQWIIDRSFLIGPDNKIKLIGTPFATPEMTKLFYSILGQRKALEL